MPSSISLLPCAAVICLAITSRAAATAMVTAWSRTSFTAAASAEAAAIKDVRDRAIAIAVAAAKEVMAKQMAAAQGNKLIDESIKQVDAKLH